MYSTCLFCNGALGANETLEHFPVGRRLAFDGASGRLWVVCTKCERWNLSPFETRWEAIEEAERAFRGTRMRVSTENIGLAKLRDGTELVRIGVPPKLEFAAWRYGKTFERRHRKAMFLGVTMVPIAALSIGGVISGIAMLNTVASAASCIGSFTLIYQLKKWSLIPALAVRDDHWTLLRLTRTQASQSRIFPLNDGTGCTVEVTHSEMQPATGIFKLLGYNEKAKPNVMTTTLTGLPAQRALSSIVAKVNMDGGSSRSVRNAVDLINRSSTLEQLLRTAPAHGGTFGDHVVGRTSDDLKFIKGGLPIGRLPSLIRLALEMSVHENDERRAMEGELHELEARWRDADAIAKIADALLLPTDIKERVDALHNQKTSEH